MVALVYRCVALLIIAIASCCSLAAQDSNNLLEKLRSEHPEWLVDGEVTTATFDSMNVNLHVEGSMDLFQLGYSYAFGQEQYVQVAECALLLASLHGSNDQPDDALAWLNRAKAEVPEEYAREHAFIENEFALVYDLKNDRTQQIRHLNQSVKYWQSVDSLQHYQCYPLGNLSTAYFDQGLYQESLDLLRQTHRFTQELEGRERLYNSVHDYSRFAALMQKLGKVDSVRFYVAQSIAEADKLGFSSMIHAAKSWALAIYLDMDSLLTAKEFILENPIKDLATVPRQDIVDGYLLQMLRYYIESGQIDKAAPLVQVVSEPLTLQSRIEHYKVMRDYYLTVGSADAARAAVDSLWNAVNTKKQIDQQNNLALASLEVEKKTLERDQESIAAWSKKQRLLIFFLSIGLVILALLSGMIWRASRQRQRILTTLSETHESLKSKNRDLKDYIDSNIRLEQFAHIAAHGLKSPLRTIASFNGLLKRQIQGWINDEEKKYLTYIEQGSENMSDLIDDLLSYAKVNSQSLQISEFTLQDVVDDVMISLEFQIQEQSASIVSKDIDHVIQADRLKVRQVIQNLISNALKFAGEDRPARVSISAIDMDDETQVCVADNGIGIETQFQDRIFQTFAKLHSNDKYDGTGIGLAICREIVVKHGGRIWVQSTIGEGTEFYFTLPKPIEEVVQRI